MSTTKLAPQFDPAAIEAGIYQRWMDAGVFVADRDSGREPYVIVIPPPNVTAALHMGHGLNNTLQDVLIRFERMRGREAEWLPGTDHAGIATQNVVERLLAQEGKTRHDLGREAFVARVWEHVTATGNQILDQLKAIGASCDWARTRFTLDEEYSHAVRKVFVQLHEDGLIYRGHRVIHWCPRCLTALSDEEAEFHDRQSNIYHIRYRLAEDPSTDVTVATTRPETIFADVCLVFDPEDERYLSLRGREALIPLIDRPIPIDASARVEKEFGTGMLKVTPAHDPNDFDIANELSRALTMPVVIDAHGQMIDSEDEPGRVPKELVGLDRDQARKRTVQLLEAAGLLERTEPYAHAVRQCYRCNTVVEPRLSDQWFVKMRPLADRALDAYRAGQLRFVPARWGKVYENWLTGIRDWNISRQLWWGHRIPAWYCRDEGCGKITVSQTDVTECSCGGAVVQDEDVLDTWFSSWLWPFATFGWPAQTGDLARFYPGHTLVTGPDIIFFWVARMVMSGYHFMGERPFATVYMNGIVRDTQHRKMSKSLGNGIDPLEVVQRYGADALRYTVVAGAATGADVVLDPDDLDTSFAVGRNFANKLWNIGRFILSNLEGDWTPLDRLDPNQLELADRWILSRTQRAIAETTAHLADFRMSDAANTVYHFLWDELADWYVEQSKPRLYGSLPGAEVARGILMHIFGTSLHLLHPMMPFITEELWSTLPGDHESMLARAAWPTPNSGWIDPAAEERFARVQDLVSAVRSIRSEYSVAPGRKVPATIEAASDNARQAFQAESPTIERLGSVSSIQFTGETEGVGAHAVLKDGSAVFVPLKDAIDVDRECTRLRTEVQRLDAQLKGAAAKLANEKFVNRAPEEVVAREREKEQAWREQRETLAGKLRSLGC